ncbi:amidohydrolase family protein [Alicyclobacillus mali (ex Roth et al. 2021)]
MPELKRIDAHQHYWRISRGDYDWMTHDMSSIRRDYLPGDLVPTLLRHNFYGSIAVQAAATYEETNFLIDLAASDSTILGVVGWIDPYDGQWLTRIEAYRRIPKWRGYRLMVEYTENTYSLLEGTSKELLMYSSLENIPIDILVRCDQLSFLLDVIDRFPNLRIILDHMGKPTMQPRDFARWA